MTIDLDFYFDIYKGTVLQNDDSGVKALDKAFRQINIICQNRLKNGAVEELSDEAQLTVKKIICEHAEFNYTNDDLINSALKKYTINGVSIEFETNLQIANIGGVYIQKTLYSELSMFGLTYRGI